MQNKSDNIIFFSSLEWNTQRQVVHEYCEYLSQKHKKVLFIENTGVRSIKFKDSSRLARAIFNLFKLKNLFYKINDNLTVFRPIYFPFFQYSKIMSFINSIIIFFFINSWIKTNKIKSLSAVSFLPTPLVQKLLNYLEPKNLIYYCIDNLAIKSSNIKIFKKYEKIFIKNSDLTICTSKKLEKNARNYTDNVIYVPSGVNFKKLNETKNNILISDKLFFENLKGLKFGFVGSVREIIDYKYIDKLINEINNSYFIFVGPIIDEPPEYIKENKKIFFLGSKSHATISTYINNFDLCLIPYIKNEFTDAIYPTKINEYLSLGKPVIATPTYEIKNFNYFNKNIINILDFKKNINDQIKKILSEKKEDLSKSISSENDWLKRFEKIDFSLEHIKNDENDENLIPNLYKNFKRKLFYLLKPIILILFIYVFATSSLFINFISSKLIITDNGLNNADTLIIFSGYGSSNYYNFQYRNRIDDAKIIIKENEIKDVIIYGRSNIFNENQLISSVLSQNAKDIKFTLINDKVRNTRDNLLKVDKILSRLKKDKVLFISTPLLYKRVDLLWKNITQKEIIFPETLSTKKIKENNIKNKNQILKVTLYEYLAIIFNYYKGWI